MKVGDLIYDHEFESFGIILKYKKMLNTSWAFEWAEVFYPWGVDQIQVPEGDKSVEVIREVSI